MNKKKIFMITFIIPKYLPQCWLLHTHFLKFFFVLREFLLFVVFNLNKTIHSLIRCYQKVLHL